jgi:hypothetical protein
MASSIKEVMRLIAEVLLNHGAIDCIKVVE